MDGANEIKFTVTSDLFETITLYGKSFMDVEDKLDKAIIDGKLPSNSTFTITNTVTKKTRTSQVCSVYGKEKR
jgi:hypothetical protein